MKKRISLLLAVVLLVLSGCGIGVHPSETSSFEKTSASLWVSFSGNTETSCSPDISGLSPTQTSGLSDTTESPSEDSSPTFSPSTPQSSTPSESSATESSSSLPPAPDLPDKDGYFYDAEGVVLYLYYYGTLPPNYLTKSEAKALGWRSGTPESCKEGAAIGGDRFQNREGLLPEGIGRYYTECDIETLGKGSRGSKRLVFSNDGLYYYTTDHYSSFIQLIVENGEVIRK